jgi:putative spermidine/putrescine transport system substrate-binding protein
MTAGENIRGDVTRRRFLAGAGALALATSGSRRAAAAEEPVLVVGVHGGIYEDVQRKVFFEPFTRETGIKIVGVPFPNIAKVKAMVDTNTVDIDLVELDGKDLNILARRGLLEKIDHGVIPKETLDGLDKIAVHPHGIGMFVWPTGIAYNTKKFTPQNHPRTWAEFWDPKRFPGARTLPAASYLVGPLEMALLADGVEPAKLYPLDVERAFKSLDRIRPHVSKFYKGSAESAQILADGHADLGANTFGRLIAMKNQGAPVDVEYNQSLAKIDYWMIPKGAKHQQNATRFIAFYHDHKRLGEYANAYPVFGPINKLSIPYIEPKTLENLATSPKHAAGLIYIKEDWWAAEDGSGKSNFEKVLDRWNQWITA